MPHALIVDAEAEALGWMCDVVRAQGFSVAAADSLRQARGLLARQSPHVLVIAAALPDGSGFELLREVESPRETTLVVVAPRAEGEAVLAALRAGAVDFLTKPVDAERLLAAVRQPAGRQGVRVEAMSADELRGPGRFGPMVGESPPMLDLYERVAKVAPTNATVLLTGESGTGKELAARTIHQLSRRARMPFLAVNCGAISPNLVESELFGHERGSFTGAERQHRGFFEQASGGTIFLDEVTEMPLDLQVKLLRVLETGCFVRVGSTTPVPCDVRVIAATNRSPEQAVADRRFREDLYHRLNVFPLRLPSLRERGRDIELLAQQFLREINRIEGTDKQFSPAALPRLHAMSWPGNVRQLRNHVHRAYILADDWVEGAEPMMPVSPSAAESSDASLVVVRVGTPLADVERRLTMATLAACGNVKRTAARTLGISLKTLYNRLEAYAEADRASATHRPSEEAEGGRGGSRPTRGSAPVGAAG